MKSVQKYPYPKLKSVQPLNKNTLFNSKHLPRNAFPRFSFLIIPKLTIIFLAET